ncbi:unnamed protein product [Cyprideis torosa]|uniref:Uncharacterized protein n=2 Tax=Cyprideis torosa TaxID=163714 RepID=A0A7R8WMU5_9CRUS|nr:unnamed protein product [Cyprideis torosa]CAG0903234.1 unnamed protein product [Cyprideis torosa]
MKEKENMPPDGKSPRDSFPPDAMGAMSTTNAMDPSRTVADAAGLPRGDQQTSFAGGLFGGIGQQLAVAVPISGAMEAFGVAMGQSQPPADAPPPGWVEPTVEPEAEAAGQSAADSPPPVAQLDLSEYGKKIISFLARNFYTMKYAALVMAFCINFILLFYKVTNVIEMASTDDLEMGGEVGSAEEVLSGSGEVEDGGGGGSGESGEEEDEDLPEFVTVDEHYYYLEYVMKIMAFVHSLLSLFILIAYYHLKVPLEIFKREKEIARRLEFDGLFISTQPDDDDIKSHWDKLVISSSSFPVNYWDKFVKKKVRQKYSETYDFDAISTLLGMEKSGTGKMAEEPSGIFSTIISVDWRYQIWKAGVTITNQSFLYSLWYLSFSMLGNLNHFFFAAHLLDVAVGFKTLRTILQSVTHNGKQLVLTVMLLTIIVYIYTVIAFNFFRRFYVDDEGEEVDRKCHDMLTCFVFHLYKGVRAGGGIGDEISPPDGDEDEVYRIIFDITFFFFIIVILLAIIQGLIIDAFGELRDQLESVKEDMESNCFICGMGKDYFDKVPHGFETHVIKEHNLANYMFFLMHLINKPDTEYTGQLFEMAYSDTLDFLFGALCWKTTIKIHGVSFIVKETIGSGGFSEIDLVLDRRMRRYLAVKKLTCHSQEDEKMAVQEIELMRRFGTKSRSGIIEVLDYDIVGHADIDSGSKSLVRILMPYYRNGSLHEELQRRRKTKHYFTLEFILRTFEMVLKAVEDLHLATPEPYAHRDLKPANILFDDHFNPVLTDFGSAAPARVKLGSRREALRVQEEAEERCSVSYRAPELMTPGDGGEINEKSDIWSLGCILYALCFFISPFDLVVEAGGSVVLAALSGKVDIPSDSPFPEAVHDLIRSMIQVDPTKRPTVSELLEQIGTLFISLRQQGADSI